MAVKLKKKQVAAKPQSSCHKKNQAMFFEVFFAYQKKFQGDLGQKKFHQFRPKSSSKKFLQDGLDQKKFHQSSPKSSSKKFPQDGLDQKKFHQSSPRKVPQKFLRGTFEELLGRPGPRKKMDRQKSSSEKIPTLKLGPHPGQPVQAKQSK